MFTAEIYSQHFCSITLIYYTTFPYQVLVIVSTSSNAVKTHPMLICKSKKKMEKSEFYVNVWS